MRRKRPGPEQKTAFPKRLVFYGVVAIVVTAVFLLVAVPNHITPRVGSNQPAAIAALRMYIGAQKHFRKNAFYGPGIGRMFANPRDGSGFPDLYRIGGPGGEAEALQLVDRAFAEAVTPERARCGYWFVDIVADPDGPYDFREECGLCAVPAKYGKTGYNTYIVEAEGTVYRKDNGGTPVTVWPDIESEGWQNALE